jgi:hypothetical protein
MLTAYRLYCHYRASGTPARAAARRALSTVWRDYRRTPYHWTTRP